MSPDAIIDALNQTHAIPGIAEIFPGSGGLAKVHITTHVASAEIYLHGAQVTSWKPAGADEVIFLSQQSHWQTGKAIRGGIPICFPWFRAKSDNPKAPAHGVVRTKEWRLDSITHEVNQVVVTLTTQSDEASRQWWPHEFRITHRISVGRQLKLELIVDNTGPTPFSFEEALHTYHSVGNVEKISIRGLDTVPYLDNRDENRHKVQSGDIVFKAPTDNAYINTAHSVEIFDPSLHRRIQIEKQNSHTTIVWTPWQQGAQSMVDMGDDEWQQFACVEASNILSSAVSLQPSQQHTMTARIGVSQYQGELLVS